MKNITYAKPLELYVGELNGYFIGVKPCKS
jgi:hypothetical protein